MADDELALPGFDSQRSGPAVFAQFWAEYPRKVGKRVAEQAFTAALKRAPAGVIMAGVSNQKPYWTHLISRNDGHYIPHPATWLNRDGWEDEVQVPAPRTAGERGMLLVDKFRQMEGGRRAIDP